MVLFFALVAIVSLVLTGFLRRYALTKEIMDIPNERSSHNIATPRGGGMAIVISVLGGMIVLWVGGHVPSTFLCGVIGAGVLVALIGWLDDRRNLSASVRLIGHFLGAGWSLFWLGGLPPMLVFGQVVDLGWMGHTLAAFYLVWLLNLYNFMDGIDGIAGIEGITVCVGGVFLSAIVKMDDPLWLASALMVPAIAGFLFWNFPIAKIFMGDAGSGFLGMVLGILSIQAGWSAPELFWGWLILLGVFVVDASVTLLRRAIRGEKVYLAHRSHAYQHAAIKFKAHPPVSLAIGAINLFWLFPVAALVAAGIIDGVFGLIIAYLPLTVLAIMFDAGKA